MLKVPVEKRPIWQRILYCLILALALGNVLQFFVLACYRLFYPFELEWIEGAFVDQARWLMEGRPLYAEPSIYMIPGPYTPLFFLTSALLMKVLGVGFVAPRLISFLSTLGCLLSLFWIVARGTGCKSCGLVAAGIYAATFRFAGAWMDLAKTDSLFLCLVLAAFCVGHQYPNRWGMVISGLLYTLAYYTKQNALLIVVVLAPLSLLVSRGRTWIQWLSTAISGFVAFAWLDIVSDGWFSFYTLHHTMVSDIWSFWHPIVQSMWPALLLSLFYLISAIGFKPTLVVKENPWHYLSLGIALLTSSWGVFVRRWVYHNVFMAACAGLGMLAGLGWGKLLERMHQSSQRQMNRLLGMGGKILLLIQFTLLFYNPFDQVPTAADRKAWEQFIGRLRERSGEVLIFHHGFAGHLAGKNTFLHSSFYGDAVSAGGSYALHLDTRWRREEVEQVLKQAVQQQVFDWVFAGESSNWLPYYLPTDEEPIRFYPVTGAQGTAETFFIKNPVIHEGVLPLNDARFNILFGEGWSAPEDWGRWTVSQQAVVQIALEEEYDYELSIEAFPFCPPEFAGQTMKVGWNDLPLGFHIFTVCGSQRITFPLSSQAISEGFNTLWFETETAIAPADVGLSGDRRPLAVGFISLSFVQK